MKNRKTLNIDETIYADLKKYCDANNMILSKVVQSIIHSFLKKKGITK